MIFKNLIFLSILTIGAFLPALTFSQSISESPTTTETLPPEIDTLPEVQGDALPATTSPSLGSSVLDNLNWFGGSLGLPDTDPRFIIANIIRQLLGFLGIILLVFILYAGFLWMLSGDNDEQRTKAKRTLFGAVIGLVIILSANSIVQFIFRTLTESTTTPPPV
ncbi:MAG TPA: pilin [Patescibacteria group bacterium]|nr:pilin [Patescibacteria group bacterium]